MKGVGFHKHSGKWKAHIWRNMKNEYVGSHETQDEAERAVMKARNHKARSKPSILVNPFAEIQHG